MEQLWLAAAGLERSGLCHGDIRPGNMPIDANRDLKLSEPTDLDVSPIVLIKLADPDLKMSNVTWARLPPVPSGLFCAIILKSHKLCIKTAELGPRHAAQQHNTHANKIQCELQESSNEVVMIVDTTYELRLHVDVKSSMLNTSRYLQEDIFAMFASNGWPIPSYKLSS